MNTVLSFFIAIAMIFVGVYEFQNAEAIEGYLVSIALILGGFGILIKEISTIDKQRALSEDLSKVEVKREDIYNRLSEGQDLNDVAKQLSLELDLPEMTINVLISYILRFSNLYSPELNHSIKFLKNTEHPNNNTEELIKSLSFRSNVWFYTDDVRHKTKNIRSLGGTLIITKNHLLIIAHRKKFSRIRFKENKSKILELLSELPLGDITTSSISIVNEVQNFILKDETLLNEEKLQDFIERISLKESVIIELKSLQGMLLKQSLFSLNLYLLYTPQMGSESQEILKISATPYLLYNQPREQLEYIEEKIKQASSLHGIYL